MNTLSQYTILHTLTHTLTSIHPHRACRYSFFGDILPGFGRVGVCSCLLKRLCLIMSPMILSSVATRRCALRDVLVLPVRSDGHISTEHINK